MRAGRALPVAADGDLLIRDFALPTRIESRRNSLLQRIASLLLNSQQGYREDVPNAGELWIVARTQRDIAYALNVTPEAVSLNLGTIERAGCISRKRGRILILNAAKLLEIAEQERCPSTKAEWLRFVSNVKAEGLWSEAPLLREALSAAEIDLEIGTKFPRSAKLLVLIREGTRHDPQVQVYLSRLKSASPPGSESTLTLSEDRATVARVFDELLLWVVESLAFKKTWWIEKSKFLWHPS